MENSQLRATSPSTNEATAPAVSARTSTRWITAPASSPNAVSATPGLGKLGDGVVDHAQLVATGVGGSVSQSQWPGQGLAAGVEHGIG